MFAAGGDHGGLTAYVDIDGNLTPDVGEPRGVAFVGWKLPPPVQGRTVNADPVFGRVRVLLPASARRAKGGASVRRERRAG